jgi:putative FmdB family regulatory protein
MTDPNGRTVVYPMPPVYNGLNRASREGGIMPTYEYRCEKCGETFERRESIAEHEAAVPKCPKCEGDRVW